MRPAPTTLRGDLSSSPGGTSSMTAHHRSSPLASSPRPRTRERHGNPSVAGGSTPGRPGPLSLPLSQASCLRLPAKPRDGSALDATRVRLVSTRRRANRLPLHRRYHPGFRVPRLPTDPAPPRMAPLPRDRSVRHRTHTRPGASARVRTPLVRGRGLRTGRRPAPGALGTAPARIRTTPADAPAPPVPTQRELEDRQPLPAPPGPEGGESRERHGLPPHLGSPPGHLGGPGAVPLPGARPAHLVTSRGGTAVPHLATLE